MLTRSLYRCPNMANQAQKLDFIVIKLGSSTLTEAGQPNHALIAGLCDDLHALRLQNLSPVLVTSGAVQLGCSASTQDGGSARTRAGRAAIHSWSPQEYSEVNTTDPVAGGRSAKLASGSALSRRTPSAP